MFERKHSGRKRDRVRLPAMTMLLDYSFSRLCLPTQIFFFGVTMILNYEWKFIEVATSQATTLSVRECVRIEGMI